ncbi:MAG: hypothetical protein JW841_01935 [Deltaproteobacteria bacterium]|nr:hypothetical protein [Deltaproteobacteria bacterium]
MYNWCRRSFIYIFSLSFLISAGCGHNDENMKPEDGHFGQRPLAFSIDLANAANLAITDQSNKVTQSNTSANLKTGIVLVNQATRFVEAQDNQDESNMVKIETDGELADAIVEAQPEGMDKLSDQEKEQMGPPPTRPRVAAVGLSPTGEVYVLFEYPFIFRLVDDPNGLDPWSPSSPFTCQLFKAELNLAEALIGESVVPMAPSNLECLTTDFEIPTWRQGLVMQFDKNGKLYFPAHISGTDQDLFYSYDPNTKALTEVVNANICWRNVEVTPAGSIFYTGTTKVDNDCSGTSFFRYISSENRLIEISRNWWEYAFTSEIDPDDEDAERILFYGPDPDTSNGLPSWESACLYRYDPSISDPDKRATRLSKCLNDFWGWVDARDIDGNNEPQPSLALRMIKKERCETDGKVFIGGSGITRLEQGAQGEVFILGELQRKLGGEFKCNVEIHGPHCSSLDPKDDKTSCIAKSFQWINEGWCEANDYYPTYEECNLAGGDWYANSKWYDNVSGSACLVSASSTLTDEEVAAGVVFKPDWQVQWVNCNTPSESNGQWTRSVRGMAYIDPKVDNVSENLPVLISGLDEDAINFWLQERDGDTVVYYSSFKTGRYLFNEARLSRVNDELTVQHRVLLEEYEVYNVSPSPNNQNRLMFDSLYFPTNTYRFGTIDVGLSDEGDIESSFEVTDGLTGRIRTLIIIPN